MRLAITLGKQTIQNGRDKATKLYNDVERIFQFKEATAVFNRMDKKANENLFETKTNLHGSEVAVQMMDIKLSSLQSEIISSVSSHSTTLFTLKVPSMLKNIK
ncbi:4734_t:CDS:2 [Entrophospora sp. SA101]|nr:4734_t:CDS:2 [Entrophospora sp. SA101]CAJ0920965.1 20364_t:CDS:2 [Entrophospora sp. SA101]